MKRNMRFSRKKNRLKKYIRGLFALTAVALTSCQAEEPVAGSATGSDIRLRASITESKTIDTRAIEVGPVTYKEFGTESFYIDMIGAEGQSMMKEYRVAAGTDGELVSKDSEDPLMWFDPDMYHYFNSWTLPMMKTSPYTDNEPKSSNISFVPNYYAQQGFESSDYRNCALLDRFVGTRMGPLSYRNNGDYVDMKYYHLVSKIKIGTMRLTLSDGNYTSNLSGTMTLYGLPKNGIFYPVPEDGSMPYVVADPNGGYGVTFDISAGVEFYVCPDIDYSDMRFSITLNGQYGNSGFYYGDFQAVTFYRVDPELGDWDKGKSDKVLYAGEMMTLNMTLRQGDAAGLSVVIMDWATKETRPGTTYPDKGIYNSAALNDLYTRFSSDYDQAAVEEAFELYGEMVNGQMEMKLYEDCDLTNHFRLVIPNEVVLNGMGHTVEIQNASSSGVNINGTVYKEVAHIGCCKDIYITNGEYTIYIDEDFYIWTIDKETGEMTKRKRLEPAPLTGTEYYSYYIDFVSGAFTPTKSH